MGVTVAWCDGVVLQLSQISSAATFSIVCELTQQNSSYVDHHPTSHLTCKYFTRESGQVLESCPGRHAAELREIKVLG